MDFRKELKMKKIFAQIKLLTVIIGSSFFVSAQTSPVAIQPIPNLSDWQSNMIVYGQQLCNRLPTYTGFDQWNNPNGLIETYYDAESVFYQIADFTGNPAWRQCAQYAEQIYRDRYVMNANNGNGGNVPGYWNFSTGLTRDFQLTGDVNSKQAAILLSQNAAFARDNTPIEETASAITMREVSYAIISYLDAEDLGEPRRERLGHLVTQQLGHLDQVSTPNGFQTTCTNVFMAALATDALIRFYEKTNDPRIPPKLKILADRLWTSHWQPTSKSFKYYNYGSPCQTNIISIDASPDLNLMIASLYGWLYHQSGNLTYLYRGDKIFAGGVTQSFLGNGKQFDQNYRGSFNYVRWRMETPLNAVYYGSTNGDYDGDGKADEVVFRSSNRTWYLNQSERGFAAIGFGSETDKPVSADFDGDGLTDIAVYRPSNGTWYIRNSSDESISYIRFGVAEDIPVPKDFDGDGKADATVFRPSNGIWYRLNSSNNQSSDTRFGLTGDKPL